MKFTDEDLERLKLQLSQGRCYSVGPVAVRLLIARLEAAERYASYVAPLEKTGEKLRKEWRKVAGQ